MTAPGPARGREPWWQKSRCGLVMPRSRVPMPTRCRAWPTRSRAGFLKREFARAIEAPLSHAVHSSTKSAGRFSAQQCSSWHSACGFSLPKLIVSIRDSGTPNKSKEVRFMMGDDSEESIGRRKMLSPRYRHRRFGASVRRRSAPYISPTASWPKMRNFMKALRQSVLQTRGLGSCGTIRKQLGARCTGSTS